MTAMQSAAHPEVGRLPGAADRLERFLADVLVVVVLYRPTPADAPTLTTLRADVAAGARSTPPALLVYDNSPAASNTHDGLSDLFEVHYRHDPTNPGVSGAYRAGAALAARLERRWLLFLDQDSELPRGAMARYADAIATHPAEVVFAPALRAGPHVVSPCTLRLLVGRPAPDLRPGVHAFQATSLLNSGLCIDRETYAAVGGHDPQIPLDYSDHEFVARLKRRQGTFVLVGVEFGHGLSAHGPQSSASRLRRFRLYAIGAKRTPRGRLGRLGARALVIARGAWLSWRWRQPSLLAAGIRSALGRD